MKNTARLSAASALVFGTALLLAPANQAVEKNPSLSPVEKAFIQQEVATAKAIIEIASTAAKRGGRENIRTFATMLVKDHEKLNAELSKLAVSKGLEPESTPSQTHEILVKQLTEEKIEAFDGQFIKLLLKLQKESIENFEKTAADSPDRDLMEWAARMLPELKAHFETAKTLGSAETVSALAPTYIVL